MTKMHMLRRLITPRIQLVAALTAAIIVAGRGAGWPTLQAQPPTNPIVLENQLTGNPQSEWDVTGSGDPTIQGFATDISVNKGGRSRSRSSCSPPSSAATSSTSTASATTRAWARARVATAVPTAQQIIDSQNQPACLQRRRAPASSTAATGASPATFDTTRLTSGIYIARLRRTDTGGASHIVFIVRDDARKADVVCRPPTRRGRPTTSTGVATAARACTATARSATAAR